MALAGGKTRRSVQPVTTEEPRWTAPGITQLTGTATPTLVATKPPSAGVLPWLPGQGTGLSFLPQSGVNARAHQRSIVQGVQGLAGPALRALHVRLAPTVAADAFPSGSGETQASERSLTILGPPAPVSVGLELPGLLQREGGNRARLVRRVIGHARPVQGAHDEQQRHGEQEPEHAREEASPLHLHVTLQGVDRQSQDSTLPSGQSLFSSSSSSSSLLSSSASRSLHRPVELAAFPVGVWASGTQHQQRHHGREHRASRHESPPWLDCASGACLCSKRHGASAGMRCPLPDIPLRTYHQGGPPLDAVTRLQGRSPRVPLQTAPPE